MVPVVFFQQVMLWNKTSLVSMDEIHKFYVHELQPFVSVRRVRQQPDGLQHSTTEVKDRVNASNITLCGSTQLVVDLAELAAEAGNETLVIDDMGSTVSTQSQATSNQEPVAAVEHSKNKTGDVPIALDGFCLQSSSVSFLYFTQTLVAVA